MNEHKILLNTDSLFIYTYSSNAVMFIHCTLLRTFYNSVSDYVWTIKVSNQYDVGVYLVEIIFNYVLISYKIIQ